MNKHRDRKETPEEFHRRMKKEHRERKEKTVERVSLFAMILSAAIIAGMIHNSLILPYLWEIGKGVYWEFTVFTNGIEFSVYHPFEPLFLSLPLIAFAVVFIPLVIIFGYLWKRTWRVKK